MIYLHELSTSHQNTSYGNKSFQMLFCLFSPNIDRLFTEILGLIFRGLHLGVIHSQTDAVRNLAQVISALPGEDVLNMRNDLYQVYYKFNRSVTVQRSHGSARTLFLGSRIGTISVR